VIDLTEENKPNSNTTTCESLSSLQLSTIY
jgi:hypothetical protein